MSQTALLKERRFWGLFWTQFLGTFNDNFIKNAVVILITFKLTIEGPLDDDMMVALCSMLIILPYVFFSIFAGRLADKFSKARIMVWVKAAEVVIMLLAAVGFMLMSLPILMAAIFLMGAQSAFFSPAKYSVLPELLKERELMRGNGLLEMGTFLAILIGTIGGGVVMSWEGIGIVAVEIGIVLLALLGLVMSLAIPKTKAAAPDLSLTVNPVGMAWESIKAILEKRPIYLAILGGSWFWFLGTVMLTVLPGFVEKMLHGQEALLIFFLAVFSVFVGVGSLLCGKFSKGWIELGLVPLGSFGISVFMLDLFFAGSVEPMAGMGAEVGVREFLSRWAGWRITLDLAGLSMCSGFFIVPLQTLVQEKAPDSHRARIISGGNLLNSIFMVTASGMLMGLFAMGITHTSIFLMMSVANLLVAVYIFGLMPAFLFRFLACVIAKIMYRFKVTGEDDLPRDTAAVVVSNHVSYMDWLLIAAACRRPVRFVVYHRFYNVPLVQRVMKWGGAIPIAPPTESRAVMRQAFDSIAEALEAGEIIFIFPEGALTWDGEMIKFRGGVERILKRTPVPVMPMAIKGMWGSYFSRYGGRALKGRNLSWRPKVEMVFGEMIPVEEVTAQGLQDAVTALRGEVL